MTDDEVDLIINAFSSVHQRLSQKKTNTLGLSKKSQLREICFSVSRKLLYASYLFIGFLFNILIRICRPFRQIRFGTIHSSRIGETASFFETYLCGKEIEKNSRYFDVFVLLEGQNCNQVLVDMYSKLVNIFSCPRLLFATLRINQLFPDSHLYVIKQDSRKHLPLFSCTKSHLIFNDDQEDLGRSQMKQIGLPENAKYVCFYARDDAYLMDIFPKRDWSYHDYRNADIQNMIPAMEELVNRGYYALRVGSIVNKPARSSNKKIIDYASSGLRSDFMDLYLIANCEFFIGDTSGIRWIPMVFRKPCIVLNLVGCGDVIDRTRPDDLLLFKKIWDAGKHRYLSLQEIRQIGINYTETEFYKRNGLELRENTPDEIKTVVLEMDSRIHGESKYTLDDERLQQKFRVRLLEDYDTSCLGRLGRSYMTENEEWFLA
jgi:putative glycosyltransferase (TIGR04372 family)